MFEILFITLSMFTSPIYTDYEHNTHDETFICEVVTMEEYGFTSRSEYERVCINIFDSENYKIIDTLGYGIIDNEIIKVIYYNDYENYYIIDESEQLNKF